MSNHVDASKNNQRRVESQKQPSLIVRNVSQSYLRASQPHCIVQTPTRPSAREDLISPIRPLIQEGHISSTAPSRRIAFDTNTKEDDKINNSSSSWNNDLRYSARAKMTSQSGGQQTSARSRDGVRFVGLGSVHSNEKNQSRKSNSTRQTARVFPERNRNNLSQRSQNSALNVQYFSTPELHGVGDNNNSADEIRRLRSLLKDREHELSSVRETFASNERAILQVLQDKQREWQIDCAGRELDWKQSLEEHLQQSRRHDDIFKRQLIAADERIKHLQESLVSVTTERDTLNVRLRGAVFSKRELEKMLENERHNNNISFISEKTELENIFENGRYDNNVSFVSENRELEKILENGRYNDSSFISESQTRRVAEESIRKVGVWSIIRNSSQSDDSSPIQQSLNAAAFKPINGCVRLQSSLRNETSSTVGFNGLNPQRRSIDSYFENRCDNEMGDDHIQDVAQSHEMSARTNIGLQSSSNIPDAQNSTTVVIGRHSSSNSLLSENVSETKLDTECNQSNYCEQTFGHELLSSSCQNRQNALTNQKTVFNNNMIYSAQKANGIVNDTQHERDKTINELEERTLQMEAELEYCRQNFDSERQKWLEEKTKVVGYQTNLEQKLAQLLGRNRALENELNRVNRLVVQLTPSHIEETISAEN